MADITPPVRIPIRAQTPDFERVSVSSSSEEPGVVRTSHRLSLIRIAGILLLCGGLGWGLYHFRHQAPESGDRERARWVGTIGAIMELPSDETPTLATVTDKDKLADQPFFHAAQNGDKILIYTQAAKAILYRPFTGKIIDVVTLTVRESTPGQTTTK